MLDDKRRMTDVRWWVSDEGCLENKCRVVDWGVGFLLAPSNPYPARSNPTAADVFAQRPKGGRVVDRISGRIVPIVSVVEIDGYGDVGRRPAIDKKIVGVWLTAAPELVTCIARRCWPIRWSGAVGSESSLTIEEADACPPAAMSNRFFPWFGGAALADTRFCGMNHKSNYWCRVVLGLCWAGCWRGAGDLKRWKLLA